MCYYSKDVRTPVLVHFCIPHSFSGVSSSIAQGISADPRVPVVLSAAARSSYPLKVNSPSQSLLVVGLIVPRLHKPRSASPLLRYQSTCAPSRRWCRFAVLVILHLSLKDDADPEARLSAKACPQISEGSAILFHPFPARSEKG